MNEPLIAVLVFAAIIFVAGVVHYNKLVVLRNRISESWSNVDTELKRRHDLIPNLVSTVRGYAEHERGLLQQVTKLRAEALSDARDSAERMRTEQEMVRALGRLIALAEDYPELKASANFLQLQEALVDTEDRIQAARRFYNANVRDYNNRVETIPSNVVANVFHFTQHAYFELPSLAERDVPRVAL